MRENYNWKPNNNMIQILVLSKKETFIFVLKHNNSKV